MNSGWFSPRASASASSSSANPCAVAAVARGSPLAEQGHGQTGRLVAALAQEAARSAPPARPRRRDLSAAARARWPSSGPPRESVTATAARGARARSSHEIPSAPNPRTNQNQPRAAARRIMRLLVILLLEPGERGADVVVLGREPLQQLGLGRAEEVGRSAPRKSVTR